MPKENISFENLNYEDFRRLALDSSLSMHEKIGFPDSYRSDYERRIYSDMISKVPAMNEVGACILDIGCGCSELPRMLMESAGEKEQKLFLLDSEEMLSQLPGVSNENVEKIPAKFPDCPEFLGKYRGRLNAIFAYSVLQYVFAEGSIFKFIDESLSLLAPGGRFLIGDIPNISMRKRFFASENGVAHHQAFTRSQQVPDVHFNQIEPNHMDDSVVFSIIGRARSAGFHGFVLPQSPELPMANRREDILILRP